MAEPDETTTSFVCRDCSALISMPKTSVGTLRPCPHCHAVVMVPVQQQKGSDQQQTLRTGAHYSVSANNTEDQYSVRQLVETPEYIPGKDYRPSAVEDVGVQDDRRRDDVPPDVPALPPWQALMESMDKFLLDPRMRIRWVGLSLAMILPTILMTISIFCLISAGGSYGGVGAGVSGLMLGMAGLLLSIGWLAVALANFLAVLRDTAQGCEEIENWPEGGFLEWIGEALIVGSALFMSALPGLFLTAAFHMVGLPASWVLPLGFWLLFPVVLLSVLETSSCIDPVSIPVWQTLKTHRGTWIIFYIVSAGLWCIWIVLSIAALMVPWLGLVVIAFLSVTAMLIYARLMGRLAWCISSTVTVVRKDEVPSHQMPE